MTAWVPGSLASKARSGLRSMRSRTSPRQPLGVRAQVGGQALAVLGARVEAAQRAQAQAQPAHLELAQQRVQQRDRLGVDRGVVGADGLGPELPELAEAPGLRLLLAVVAAQVPELHRLGERVHAVLEVGAAHRARCPRGAASASARRRPGRCTSPSGRCRSTRPPRGRRARWPRRSASRCARSRPARGSARAASSRPARATACVGQHVVRAARRLGPLAHRPASACRKGFVARSRPSVVSPM